MRKWFILAFSANMILIVISLQLLPEKVATHFSLGGVSDSWNTRESYVLILLAIEIPLFLLQLFIPARILKIPERIVNLPNKEYWFKPENKPRMQALFANRMTQMGTFFFLFLAAVQWLVINANLSNPVRLKESLFLPIMVAFILYMLYWTVTFIRTFRIPERHESKPTQELGK
jgi:uncharacterized membrane protein